MNNPPFNIVDLFYNAAEKEPGKTALIYREKKIDFKTFATSITETAIYFQQKGIQKGDRVMVFVPMSDDLYRIVLALFRIGAVAVFLDEWVSVKRLNVCCRLAECKAFIGTKKGLVLAWFVPGLRKIPLHLGVSFKKDLPLVKFAETSREDIALITFTTGSTGVPKAAIRTHGLLHEQFNALTPLIRPEKTDVSMPVLPVILLLNLGNGVTSVIVDFKGNKPDSLKPEKIVAQIKKHSVNCIISSPFFVKEISKYLLRNKLDLPIVNKIFTGGAPVFPNEAMLYKKAFKSARIEIVYGSTEAEPISSINVETLVNENQLHISHGLKVGKPDAAADVKIIRITDHAILLNSENELKALQLPAGEIGEIIVSGKHVLRNYLNNFEALRRNKIVINNNVWHRTGDSGYFDEPGNLYLTGRCSTLITIDNRLLTPFMYENYFQTWNGVEVGTILMVDNVLTAVIELNEQTQKDAVTETIWQLPDRFDNIIFISKIPRDPRHNSKIDYDRLIKLL